MFLQIRERDIYIESSEIVEMIDEELTIFDFLFQIHNASISKTRIQQSKKETRSFTIG